MLDGKLEYWPFYAYAWEADITQRSLDNSGAGIYVRLLNMQFLEESVPGDPEVLRDLLRASREEWDRTWAVLEPKFPLGKDDRRRNPKMMGIRKNLMRLYSQRSRAGQAGARSRWSKNPQAGDSTEDKPMRSPWQSHTTANATALRPHCDRRGNRNRNRKGKGTQDLPFQDPSDPEQDLSIYTSERASARSATTKLLKWNEKTKSFEGERERLRVYIHDNYREEFGEEWISAQWSDCLDWCRDNEEKIRAKKDCWKFVLGWFRRNASRSRNGGVI